MNARGFTLLEVLVALAILSTAVVASIQGFAQGLRLLKLSGDHQEAMLLADQKVREVTAPVEGSEDGTEARFQWTRTVKRLPTPELEGSARTQRWQHFEIDVRVRWDERREVQVSTLRTLIPGELTTFTVPVPPGGTPAPPPGTRPSPTPPAGGTRPPAR
jgi:type II secretion system protein I